MASPSSAVSSRWFRTRRGPLVYCASSLLAAVLAFAAGPSGCSLNDAGIGGGSGSGVQPTGCMQDTDCNDNNPCTDDTCSNHMCNHTGNGHVPDDHNECTVDSCKGGIVTNDAMAAKGQKCGANSMLTCDGMGHCGGCMKDGDCGASTECQKWSCNTGTNICDVTNSPVGTMATDMTPGDCLGTFCDGNGGTKDAPLAQGTTCSVSNGSVCDMAGKCVGCVADTDCKTGLTPSCDPVSHQCTTCDDGKQNGAETGVDCGGPKCAKCQGDTCGLDMDCAHGLPCVDKVCCEGACSDQCKACNIQGQLGKCTNVPLGNEDLPACNSPTYLCNGNGGCGLSFGHPCNADATCYNNACRAGFCRGAVGDTCTDKAECASNRCVAGKCASCSADGDCSGSTCNQGTQRCTGAYNDPCKSDAECFNGKCRNGLCRNDVDDNCSANNQCVTELCKMGKCKPCLGPQDCTAVNPVNAQCGPDVMLGGVSICQLSKGSYCDYNYQCATQICTGFPAKCQ